MRLSILSAWSSTSELPLEDGRLPGPEAVESYPLSKSDALSPSIERANRFRNGPVEVCLGYQRVGLSECVWRTGRCGGMCGSGLFAVML